MGKIILPGEENKPKLKEAEDLLELAKHMQEARVKTESAPKGPTKTPKSVIKHRQNRRRKRKIAKQSQRKNRR